MELLQLRYFYDSANMGSLAKTASKHMVPASSVSASIKRLEEELGFKVFDRTANRIRLNENGRQLLRSLNVVFNELDRLVDNASTISDDEREIWILVKAIRAEMTDRIISYKKQNISAKFKIVSDFNEKNFDHYDVVIDTMHKCYKDFSWIELCSQAICIYTDPDNPLAEKELRLRDLKEMPFASMSQYGNQYRRFTEACAKKGFTPILSAQINDIACFVKLIESGIALGVASDRSLCTQYEPRIQKLNVIDFKEHQTVYLYYKSRNAVGGLERFIDFLRNSF